MAHQASVIGAAIAVAAASLVAASQWAQLVAPVQIELPRDHGAHPAYRTEWWYLTGVVEDENSNRYGVQVTFFRHGLDPSPPQPGESTLRAHQVLSAHLAVADITRGRFLHAQRIRRAAAGLAGFSREDLRVWVDDWQVERAPSGVLMVEAGDRAAEVGAHLELRPLAPLTLHGDRGLSTKGSSPGNASMYLSWTRLAVAGEIELNGRSVAARGQAWLDHEWGSSQLGEGVVGWDWFGLRLDNGSDLMIYRLRRSDGSADPHSSGTLVQADGTILHLEASEVSLTVTDSWASPQSGAVYPAGWRLIVHSTGLDLVLEPMIATAEVDGRSSTGVIYWEGPVTVTGSHTGEGYAELTGYAGSLAGRF